MTNARTMAMSTVYNSDFSPLAPQLLLFFTLSDIRRSSAMLGSTKRI